MKIRYMLILILIIGIVLSRFVMMNILVCNIGVIFGCCVVFFKNLLFNKVKLIVVFNVLRLISRVVAMRIIVDFMLFFGLLIFRLRLKSCVKK